MSITLSSKPNHSEQSASERNVASRPSIRPSFLLAVFWFGVLMVLLAAVWFVRLPTVVSWVVLPWCALLAVLTMRSTGRIVQRWVTRFHIWPDRVEVSSGILRRQSKVLFIKKVPNIQVEQNPLQGLLELGTVRIACYGRQSQVSLPDVPDPYHWRDLMVEYFSQASSRSASRRRLRGNRRAVPLCF
jgi:membrane protein YdbS with pleckstrin-like domain